MPFIPFNPFPNWTGFYQRPMGNEPCFHVSRQNIIQIIKNDGYNIYIYNADMNSSGMNQLAISINQCKAQFAGVSGGSFSINEYGDVIVPLNNSSAIKVVGCWSGKMYFYDGTTRFSLDEAFQPGADWPYPYLGMKYHLAQRDYIYREINTAGGTSYETLPFQCNSLVNALRAIRPTGPMTFVVNPSGVVLAKKQVPQGTYSPCYLGKLDYTQWFPEPYTVMIMTSTDIQNIILRLNQIKHRMPKSDSNNLNMLIQQYWALGRTLISFHQKSLLFSLKNKYL